PRGEGGGRVVELLDAVVVGIGDVAVPAPVGRHAFWVVELPVAAARAAPRGEEGAAARARWYRGRCSVRERSGGHGCRSRTRRARGGRRGCRGCRRGCRCGGRLSSGGRGC